MGSSIFAMSVALAAAPAMPAEAQQVPAVQESQHFGASNSSPFPIDERLYLVQDERAPANAAQEFSADVVTPAIADEEVQVPIEVAVPAEDIDCVSGPPVGGVADALPSTLPPANAACAPQDIGADNVPEGIIIVTAQTSAPPGDPLAEINAKTYEATQAVDRAIVGPIAMAYDGNIPEPVRDGIGNFLNNVREPLVFVNFLLQLKIGKAFETAGRFAINSTIGVGGLFDVAKSKPINLPRRSNGFADTLGYYGVKPGAFLFLPILGPTTVRDAIGGGLDSMFLPTLVGKPFNRLAYTVPSGALNSLGERADFDDQLKKIREESNDPYTAAREYYLQHRQAEIEVLQGKRASVDSPLYETLAAEAAKAEAVPENPAQSARQEGQTKAADQALVPADAETVDVIVTAEISARPKS
ncbi:MAG: VacJ family lipoprotein [Pontixanthobacter sp.]